MQENRERDLEEKEKTRMEEISRRQAEIERNRPAAAENEDNEDGDSGSE